LIIDTNHASLEEGNYVLSGTFYDFYHKNSRIKINFTMSLRVEDTNYAPDFSSSDCANKYIALGATVSCSFTFSDEN